MPVAQPGCTVPAGPPAPPLLGEIGQEQLTTMGPHSSSDPGHRALSSVSRTPRVPAWASGLRPPSVRYVEFTPLRGQRWDLPRPAILNLHGPWPLGNEREPRACPQEHPPRHGHVRGHVHVHTRTACPCQPAHMAFPRGARAEWGWHCRGAPGTPLCSADGSVPPGVRTRSASPLQEQHGHCVTCVCSVPKGAEGQDEAGQLPEGTAFRHGPPA